jgi:CubicO group peptidase (beta-lactamase class C family)
MKIIPAIILVCQLASFASGRACPPLGPVLPAPEFPSKDSAVIKAVEDFRDSFTNMTNQFKASALSIGVKSIHETSPMVDVHHTPDVKSSKGAQVVDATTVYRVGSITKIFTVLSALKQPSIDFERPVTEYLPELRQLGKNGTANNGIESVDWEHVTIGSLASHLAGIGADYKLFVRLSKHALKLCSGRRPWKLPWAVDRAGSS